MITKNYLTFEEWVGSLQKYVQLTPEQCISACNAYDNLVSSLESYANFANDKEDGKQIQINMYPFTGDDHSNQVISHPNEVLDMSKNIEDKFNWHGQNTSRWIFACGILFDKRDGRFSMHT